MKRVICWEARTRGALIEVETSPMGSSVFLERPVGAMTPTWARQLAETLLAAADIAEAEDLARVTGGLSK